VGPVAYFERQDHSTGSWPSTSAPSASPSYSYEEFVRGLRLRDSKTIYEDGYLLRLVRQIEDEVVPGGEDPLPWVLILMS